LNIYLTPQNFSHSLASDVGELGIQEKTTEKMNKMKNKI